MSATTLVLGIGNTLLRDDGVGVRAVEHMRQQFPDEDVDYLDGGTLSFTLASYLEAADHLIAIDAAELGGPPGSCRCFQGPAMDRFLARPRRSVHEVSLADLLDMARLTQRLPERRALLGIQPGNTTWGEQLSAPVEQAMRQTVDRAWRLIRDWREGVRLPPKG